MIIPHRPGDCLVYKPTSLIGRLIAIKTWSPFSHVEIITSPGMAIGARSEGIDYNPIRFSGLSKVVRPNPEKLKLEDGISWFETFAHGKKYDYWGLLRFFSIGKQSEKKYFCSELATQFYRHAGFPFLFHSQAADQVPPGWFVTLADDFEVIWNAQED
jgi:hypothetical protein